MADGFSITFYKDNIITLMKIAIPMCLSFTLESATDLIMFHYIGVLKDPMYLGAVGLGFMWSNITTLTVLIGFGTSLQTLCSQCFGNKDYYMCGTYHLRARFVIFLIGVPLSLLTLCSESMLLWLGIEQRLAHHAYIYSMCLIPCNFVISQYEITKRYLLTQKIVKPVVVGNVVMTICCPIIFHILFNVFNMSYLGSAVGRSLLYIINNIFLIVYIQFTNCCGETWFCFNKDSIKDLWVFVKLGIFGALMMCFEWWGFECISAMAGNLGEVQLASSVIVFNMTIFIYKFSLGIQIGGSSLIGNAVGSGNTKEAKLHAKISLLINLLVILFVGFFVMIFKVQFSKFFSTNVDVLEILCRIMALVIVIEVFDTNNGVCQNIIIGLGKQHLATIVNLISYYAIMLPTAYVLAFRFDYKVFGLWRAILITVVIESCVYGTILLSLDWEKITQESLKMMQEESQKSSGNKKKMLDSGMKEIQ